MDPRTIELGTDAWLTDSRVYNLVWLGRWIERAQTVARVLLWAAEQDTDEDGRMPGLDDVGGMAAAVQGVSVSEGDSALDALLTRDSGTSLRGCLAAARYNATHVAPVEVVQCVGAAIYNLDTVEPTPSTPVEVASLMRSTLEILDQLHHAVEGAWFHTGVLSEEEVYRRFIQQ